MKKFVFGFTAGLLAAEAILQLAWITGQWDEVSQKVDEALSNKRIPVFLRDKWDAFVESTENDRFAFDPDEFGKLVDSLNDIRAKRGLPPV